MQKYGVEKRLVLAVIWVRLIRGNRLNMPGRLAASLSTGVVTAGYPIKPLFGLSGEENLDGAPFKPSFGLSGFY